VLLGRERSASAGRQQVDCRSALHESDAIGAALGTDAFRGHDGLRALVSALGEGFESYAAEIDEARITREGVLLLRGHVDTRSRGTHMDLSMQLWQVIEFREGLAFNLVQFDKPPAAWDESIQIA
jgi:hypothetical protein